MGERTTRLLHAVSDVTIGTAIVVLHALLADRDRLRDEFAGIRSDTRRRSMLRASPRRIG